jgi:molecular chaperone HtpG
MIDDEAKRDSAKYNAWYPQFSAFLTEGAHLDHDNREALFKLLRFNSDFTEKPTDMVSLEDYTKKMLKG